MITYRSAEESDMFNVAELHMVCFKGTFIASLGEQLIADYYLEFLKEGGPFVLACDEDRLVGMCMGYYKGTQAKNMFITKNRVRLSLRLLALCLSLNKLAYKKCWNYIFPGKTVCPVDKPKIDADSDLLSICVREEYRGQGVSRGLVEEFEKRLIEAEKKDVTLSVYMTNARAITFYKKIGYTVVSKSVDEYKMYKRLMHDNN